MTVFRLHALGLLISIFLGGCTQLPPKPDGSEFAPVYPPAVPESIGEEGSIFRAEHNMMLYTDRAARRVGDLITIELTEANRSSKSSDASISKNSDVSVNEPTVLGSLIRGVAGNGGFLSRLRSNTVFEGESDSGQSNQLTGTITVTVSDVLPNGTLVVRGEKWFTLNQGEEYIRIAGLVRPDDISTDNTVQSTRVANARITYRGKGVDHDSNTPGWLTQFFISPLWPF